MKNLKGLLSIAVALLLFSPAVYCENSTQMELRIDSKRWPLDSDSSEIYTAEFGPIKWDWEGNTYTVNLVIPLDVEIDRAYMRLKNEGPTDVEITLGSEPIADPQNVIGGFEFTENLNSHMETMRGNLIEGERVISVPLVFSSQERGETTCQEFSLKFRISAVEELESVLDFDGIPMNFHWKPGAGSNPRYDLQVLLEKDTSDPEKIEVLLEQPNIVNAFYKLKEDDISNLKSKLSP